MLKLCIKLKDKVYANSLQAAHRLTMANYEDKFTYPKKRKHDLPHAKGIPLGQGFLSQSKGLLWRDSFGLALERRLDKDHEKTTNSGEAWIYQANCQRVLNGLQYNTI